MKNLIQYIFAALLCLIVFSCSNDFLSEEPDVTVITESEILISPEWGAQDISFYVPNTGNAYFDILKIPDWLLINATSGQFTDDVATINCSASVNNSFSEIGIYKDLLVLDIEGKGNTLFPISYITEGNPVIETEQSLTLPYYGDSGSIPLVVKNIGQGILLFSIVEMPEDISISEWRDKPYPISSHRFVIPQDREIVLTLLYDSESIHPDKVERKIVITSNDKINSETVIDISFDLGEPSLYCNTTQLNFGLTELTQTLDFSNQGNRLLTWEIESCPEWLSVSEMSGSLSPDSWENILFVCDRSLLPEGEHTETIYLRTNDKNNPSHAIAVTVVNYTTTLDKIIAIDGIVTDACLDKTADILYLTTNQPNRLLAYNTKTRTIDGELPLSKAPNCFSISEDGYRALIGHSGSISLIDLEKFSVTKTMDVDYNLFDIEWGDGNWCCYTPREEIQWYNLQWKNLDTEETYDTSSENNILYGNTLIKKIPHQNYIVASRLMFSNSGINVFDIMDRSGMQYFSEDIGRFWFSPDGSYLFSSRGHIYETSSLLTSFGASVSPIGSISTEPSQINWVDHHPASHSVWVLDTQDEIRQYEDNHFTYVKTYHCEEFYEESPVQVQYIFSNSAGYEVIAIKCNKRNAWAVEHIPVTK